MHAEREEYLQIARELDGDVPGRRAARRAMDASGVQVHGEQIGFSFIPYLFNAEDRAYIEGQCKTAHAILCKVIDRFLEDPAYRAIFHFPKAVEDLILLPCPYGQRLPMGRFDLFLDEQDLSYKFCEFNTDGSGAMSRDLAMGRALMQSSAFKAFAARHELKQYELFDSWVEAFLRIYREGGGRKEHPSVAVTDFAESGVFSDFDRFVEAFRRAGCEARFVDARAFEFDGEQLIDPEDGQAIDAIYRRAVTSELVGHLDECRALIDAVAAEKVCLIGHFRTTVAHSKMVNVALFDKRTQVFLTPEERAFVAAYVPRTYRLLSGSEDFALDDLLENKDAWIIKPADDYGAHGVYPGVDFDDAEWERVVKGNLDNGYIVQEYYPPHEVELIDVHVDEEDPCKVERWQSMPGVYMYDGEPAGFYCRLGQEGVIALDHNGLAAPSFMVD